MLPEEVARIKEHTRQLIAEKAIQGILSKLDAILKEIAEINTKLRGEV